MKSIPTQNQQRQADPISLALMPEACKLSIDDLWQVVSSVEPTGANSIAPEMTWLASELSDLEGTLQAMQWEATLQIEELVLQRRIALLAEDVDAMLQSAKRVDPKGHATLARRLGVLPRYLQARLLRRAIWPEVWANAAALELGDGTRPCDLWPEYFDGTGRLLNPERRASAVLTHH